MHKSLKISLLIIVTLIIAGAVYAYPLLDIFTGYSAKDTCSCLFVAGRDFDTSDEDLRFTPLNISTVDVNYNNKSVQSSILGLKNRTAIYRKGLGCVLLEGKDDYHCQFNKNNPQSTTLDSINWPYGNRDNNYNKQYNKGALDSAFNFAFNPSHKTRALVVVKNNQLVKEEYAKGFDKNTSQLGWSMSKNIATSLVGILANKGAIDINKPVDIPKWKNDGRKDITMKHLLHMGSGLSWQENYYTESEVVKMLFKNEDHYKFSIDKPLADTPGTVRNYSSGTSNIISGLIRKLFDNDEDYWAFPYHAFLHKIGMYSAQMETDEAGNYIMSSYTYATPRDWAKLGILYLNNGNWNGEQILTKDWVTASRMPDRNNPKYGYNFVLNTNGEYYPDAPKDIYVSSGFNGQKVIIVPSENMVIVRMGLSNDFDANKLITEIIASIP